VVVTLLATILDLVLVFVPSLFIVPGLATIDAARLFTFGWVVALGLLATAPMGAAIGSLVKSAGAGLGLTVVPLVALVTISGIFYPITAFPVWVQWIAQVFPVYWIGLGLRSAFAPPAAAVVEIGGTYRPLITLLVLVAWAVVGLLLTPRLLRRMAQRVTGSEIEAAKQRRMVGGY
jgi:ABC-2 type transport system permease protein